MSNLAEKEAQTPTDLIRVAVETGADVDKLERLMDLQERWEANQARKAFVEALAKFQSELPEIPKTREVHRAESKGGGLLYKFANLDDIRRVIAPLMAKNKLYRRFDFEPTERGLSVKCIITHEAGHSETTTVFVPATKGLNTNPAQDGGIMQSYGMRYALIGALGITTANADTDANPPPQKAVKTVTQKQAAELCRLVKETGAPEGVFLGWAGVSDYEHIPAAKYKAAHKRLTELKATSEELPL